MLSIRNRAVNDAKMSHFRIATRPFLHHQRHGNLLLMPAIVSKTKKMACNGRQLIAVIGIVEEIENGFVFRFPPAGCGIYSYAETVEAV